MQNAEMQNAEMEERTAPAFGISAFLHSYA